MEKLQFRVSITWKLTKVVQLVSKEAMEIELWVLLAISSCPKGKGRKLKKGIYSNSLTASQETGEPSSFWEITHNTDFPECRLPDSSEYNCIIIYIILPWDWMFVCFQHSAIKRSWHRKPRKRGQDVMGKRRVAI